MPAIVAVESLLDTGAATAVMSEELVIGILNHAVANGLNPKSEDWLLKSLQYWGGARQPGDSSEEGTGVAEGAPLQIVARVVLLTIFVGINGKKAVVPIYYKVFKKGHCKWKGAILGGPALEAAPAGLGFKPQSD